MKSAPSKRERLRQAIEHALTLADEAEEYVIAAHLSGALDAYLADDQRPAPETS